MHRALAVVFTFLPQFALAQTIHSGDIDLKYTPGNEHGAAITFRSVPITRGSSLQLYAPGWKQDYYSSNADHPASESKGDAIQVSHHARKVEFSAIETIRSAGENKIEFTLKGKLESKVDAQIEWCLGLVNAFALYGGKIGDLSIAPEPGAVREPSTLVKDSGEFRIDSRLGAINIKVEQGPAELSLMDGRRSPTSWWAREEPTMWLGMLGAKIKPGEEFTFRVTLAFEPVKHEIGKPVSIEAFGSDQGDAFIPTSSPPRIIPTPKRYTIGEGKFRITRGKSILFDTEKGRRGAESLRAEVKVLVNWDWEPGLYPGIRSGGIRFVEALPPRDLEPERYRIHVTPNVVEVNASSAAGFFYAAQTIKQMFEIDKDGLFIHECEIDDWPSLEFRGVHLFVSKDVLPLQKTLIERVWSRFKLNHLVLESEYAQWETDPKLSTPQSIPKDQLRQYVQYARENFLEPIPLVQSLGHCEWMFTNGRNRDLAEYPDAPYAYDATNPASYRFIHNVYAEMQQIFESKFFHIGHDEVTINGHYPWREESKKWGVTKLFTHDVAEHDKFFRPSKVQMMLWGDMLLSREESSDSAANAESVKEAKARRSAIPKDAIICDWHYEAAKPDAYKSLKVFKDEGFKTLACTWYSPENIYSFAQAARDNGAWGLLQTTWAGYHLTDETIDREVKQFTAHVLAAEYAWNPDGPKPDELPWRAEDVFMRAMNPLPMRIAPQAGTVFEAAVESKNDLGFDAIPKESRFDGYSFRTSPIVLDGVLLPSSAPRSVTIALNCSASELAIVMTCGFPAKIGEKIANIEITYADGTSDGIPIRYGKEVRAIDDMSATTKATLAWSGKSKSGLPIGVRLLRWKNALPAKGVKQIIFSTDHAYASPALLGITAINP